MLSLLDISQQLQLKNISLTRNFVLLHRNGVILPTIETVGYLTQKSYTWMEDSFLMAEALAVGVEDGPEIKGLWQVAGEVVGDDGGELAAVLRVEEVVDAVGLRDFVPQMGFRGRVALVLDVLAELAERSVHGLHVFLFDGGAAAEADRLLADVHRCERTEFVLDRFDDI